MEPERHAVLRRERQREEPDALQWPPGGGPCISCKGGVLPAAIAENPENLHPGGTFYVPSIAAASRFRSVWIASNAPGFPEKSR